MWGISEKILGERPGHHLEHGDFKGKGPSFTGIHVIAVHELPTFPLTPLHVDLPNNAYEASSGTEFGFFLTHDEEGLGRIKPQSIAQ